MDVKYNEIGYLYKSFQIFHLVDTIPFKVPIHYHDFKKILICLSKDVGYFIEGKQYKLYPDDIVFIDSGEIHRPIVNTKRYERIIIYISNDFVDNYKNFNLTKCFEEAKNTNTNIYRGSKEQAAILINRAVTLSANIYDRSSAPDLLRQCRLIEFLILLNDFVKNDQKNFIRLTNKDTIISKVIEYISSHLTEDISINDISNNVHINRSYLMHKFKRETGYTIKKYITEKRLFKARYLLQQKVSIIEACYTSGFTNYTSFYKAYKRRYGCSPQKDTRKDTIILKE